MRDIFFKPPILATTVLLLFVGITFGIRASESKMHLSDFEGAGGPFEILVAMPFEPEAFHIAKLQAAGRIVGVEGNHVHLRAVGRTQLKSLSWKPWIERLEPVPEAVNP